MATKLLRQRINKMQYVVPTEGGTVTMDQNPEGDLTLILAPATNLNAITLNWITSPNDGQQVTVLCNKNIASITSGVGTLNRSASSIIGGTSFRYSYDATNATWMLQYNTSNTMSAVVPLTFSVSVAGGAGDAVLYATSNGLSNGTALFSSIQNVDVRFDAGNPNFANLKPVISNGNKTITIPCRQQTFTGVVVLSINVLGSNTIGNAPNGTALTVVVTGVLA